MYVVLEEGLTEITLFEVYPVSVPSLWTKVYGEVPPIIATEIFVLNPLQIVAVPLMAAAVLPVGSVRLVIKLEEVQVDIVTLISV